MSGPERLRSTFRARRREVVVPADTVVELVPGVLVGHAMSFGLSLVVLDQREPEAPAVPVPLREGGRLVSWEPRWTPPVVRSACPSCGRVADRTATNWTGRPGSVRVHLECRGSLFAPARECHRAWDERVPVPAEPTNPELWR